RLPRNPDVARAISARHRPLRLRRCAPPAARQHVAGRRGVLDLGDRQRGLTGALDVGRDWSIVFQTRSGHWADPTRTAARDVPTTGSRMPRLNATRTPHTNPSSRARSANSPRDSTPSFAKMFDRCVLAVRAEIPSAAPISLFDRRAAT